MRGRNHGSFIFPSGGCAVLVCFLRTHSLRNGWNDRFFLKTELSGDFVNAIIIIIIIITATSKHRIRRQLNAIP